MSRLHDAATLERPRAAALQYRDLLVHVEAGPAAAPRLDVAVALARRFEATLIGVGAESIDAAAFTDLAGFASSELMVTLRQTAVQNLARAEQAFRARAVGLDTQWLTAEDMPVDAMARVSRSADLIVAGGAPPRPDDPYRLADPARLMLKSGRPVLVAPHHGGRLHGDAVVVAWKDTREARRALADSLPLLRAAELVVVLEVCENERIAVDAEVRTSAVADHLRRHDVAASAKVSVAPAYRVVDEIQRAARLVDADLIVSGGYGHSRLGEWMFGGVTRELLRDPQHFVLISH